MSRPDIASRPLVLTAVDDHLDAVLRLCAGAGVEPMVCPDPATARTAWPYASVVVVGDDVLETVVDHPLERRPDVFVVAADDPPPSVWSSALAVGAQSVVCLPRDDDVLAVVLVDRADGSARDAPVIAVASGSGGTGASTLACAVAQTAARDPRVAGQGVLLVDGDPWGGGLDILLGEERAPGLRWGDLASTDGRLSGSALRRAVPRVGDLGILSWQRGVDVEASEAVVRSVLAAARRAHGLVVADLPRSRDAGGEAVLAMAAKVLVVASDDVRGVGAAAAMVEHADLSPSRGCVVVRRHRGGVPPGLVAEMLGLPLLATMGDDPRLRRAVEEGLGPLGRRTAIRAAAREIWARLAEEID